MHALLFIFCLLFSLPALAETGHGLAMHGALKYPAGFKHFDYVNPDAPKGGEVRLAEIGGWDSLNPFIVKGEAAAGSDLPFETLLTGSADEPFSEYGLIAETVETPADRSWVIYTLRPQARWHDRKPITADDVVFSFEILKAKGHPRYRFYYAAVDKVEKLAERRVKFSFKPGDNRELPLIIGQLPILPKHYWQGRDFGLTTLEPPLGSGPYKIATFETQRSITYERVKDYWGADLPVRRGMNNFDRIRYDSYRDTTVALEAFKAGEYDWRLENEARKWATGYKDWQGLKDGRGRQEAIPHRRPAGMQGYAYNLRRPLFQDVRVRRALAYAFDFEWSNKTLFYGQYKRTASYFANSELAAEGLPGPLELAVLEPLRAQLPPEVFTEAYRPPMTDGEGNIRPNLRAAMKLLEEAGWDVVDGKLVKDGQPFVFEILLVQPVWERITLPFARALARLGIEANVRTVDTAQYKNRLDHYDFDMIVHVWGQSQSPGNEQASFWGSESADQPGGQNLAGIKSPAIDALIDQVISAPDRDALVARTRALDRALLWGHYVIPHWHLGTDRLVWWDKFGRPKVSPSNGTQFLTWWVKP
ncbi:hypothetical protein CU669_01365 [Paramagnetospirillum kuznetsovii]|uniref:Solute-binding protein family 5 domain-containing protein n=1 Tax=Paramagnetospirillum kuznetsovii TaxID=2053833 RepID=A0A364P397_9PROT|nr:extracellular solute-binding protein [Paramagnetospirillum kuznetsovii]RAU23771.1 hypothetical protein CU669_01365 [Paramagnetospirillum kuznetsovii]